MPLCVCVCVNESCDPSACDTETPIRAHSLSALRRRQSHFCHLAAFARVAWVCIGEFHVAVSHGENTLSQIERKRSDHLEKRCPRLAADNISNCAGRMNPKEQRSELRVELVAYRVTFLSLHPTRATVVWFGLESVDDLMIDDPWAPSRRCRPTRMG